MLTNTTLHVLALSAFCTKREIGEHLDLTEPTVKWHLQKAYRALKVPDNVQGKHRRLLAVAMAIDQQHLTWHYMAQVERALHHNEGRLV